MSKFLKASIAVALIIFTVACQHNVVFDQYKTIPQKSWDKDSVLVFTIPVSDTLQNYNLSINVRNDINYAYSNLWLFISIEQPDGQILDDKFEIALAEPSGKWLGKGMGGLKTREVMYRRNVFFPMSGDYTFRIEQGMRQQQLRGISDVGIKIEKVE